MSKKRGQLESAKNFIVSFSNSDMVSYFGRTYLRWCCNVEVVVL